MNWWRQRRVTRLLSVGMLLAMAIGAVTLAASLLWSGHRQQQALAKVQSLGGSAQTQPIGPPWLWRLPGGGYLPQRMIGVEFHGPQITDAELAHLKGLTGVRHLTLLGTHITDAGLAHLAELKELEALYMEGGDITDAGLLHLRRLTKLKTLMIPCCPQITDSAVDELRRALPGLKVDRAVRA